jgi:hypothetical protein
MAPKTNTPPLPSNIGKKRTIVDITGVKQYFTVLDEVIQAQSTAPNKVIYLQKLQFEDGHIELRLAYYILGEKPKMAGKWVWGQYATMIPAKDFQTIINKASKNGWFKINYR